LLPSAGTVQRSILLGCLFALLAPGADASACSVPVFRYALERWASDLFEVDVFHRGPLTAAQQAAVSALEDRALVNGGELNWEIVPCDLATELDPDLQAVWEALTEPDLPFVAVRLPGGRQGSPVAWSGPLSAAVTLLDEVRAERELARRILTGDAVVWLVLRGTDAEAADRVVKLLNEQAAALVDEIELPAGVGLPGSELLARIPLEVRFSVVDVAAKEAANSLLRRTAMARRPEPVDETATLVVPVFGRGRGAQVLTPAEVDADVIAELSRFLCGACSCQVKELNPGFDLLLPVAWDERLYGDGVPSEVTDVAAAPPAEPEYVAIPAGASATASAPSMEARELTAEDLAANRAAAAAAAAQPDEDSTNRRRDWYSLAACVLIVVGVYAWRRRAAARRAALSDRL